MAKIKINDIGYSLIETKDFETEWYKDSQIINVQEEMPSAFKNVKQVNYNTVFDEYTKLQSEMN